MSVQNPERVVTKQDLKDFYDDIFPYLGGSAAAGFTPVGTIIAVMGVTAPTNYLACNGQTVNIADYPELANYFYQQFGSKNKFGGDGTTTFGIPDLRGEFLRGTGSNGHSKQGNGAAVGTHQDATEHLEVRLYGDSGGKARFFAEATNNTTSSAWSAFEQNPDSSKGVSGGTRYAYQTDSKALSVYTNVTDRYRYMSRPTNTSVLYCIAVKNIFIGDGSPLNYSTDEQVVGTWIDGKTLYNRTFKIERSIDLTDSNYKNQWIELMDLTSIGIDVSNPVVFKDNVFSPYNDLQTHIPANWVSSSANQSVPTGGQLTTYVPIGIVWNFQTSTNKIFTKIYNYEERVYDMVFVFTLQYTKV